MPLLCDVWVLGEKRYNEQCITMMHVPGLVLGGSVMNEAGAGGGGGGGTAGDGGGGSTGEGGGGTIGEGGGGTTAAAPARKSVVPDSMLLSGVGCPPAPRLRKHPRVGNACVCGSSGGSSCTKTQIKTHTLCT